VVEEVTGADHGYVDGVLEISEKKLDKNDKNDTMGKWGDRFHVEKKIG
jgi:hypothetical protein